MQYGNEIGKYSKYQSDISKLKAMTPIGRLFFFKNERYKLWDKHERIVNPTYDQVNALAGAYDYLDTLEKETMDVKTINKETEDKVISTQTKGKQTF